MGEKKAGSFEAVVWKRWCVQRREETGLLDEDRKGTQRTAVTPLSASLTSVSEHMPPISASSAQSHIGMPPATLCSGFQGTMLLLPLMLFTLFSQFILLSCSSKEVNLWNPTYSILPNDYGTLEDMTQKMPSELVVSRSSRTPWSRSLDSNLTVKEDR